ncbi:START-like domain-containing protein [Parapedobacter soli]|uniref:START-like domain-containing protein n=1 Tax=Parapedobacter soli TaxID=416955 RepID=UPI0021CAB829|nr:START-like domain-containing protein [Parapedobacter soli]
MAEKIKFHLEYEIKSSPKILFSFLHEPNALAQWFADDVNFKDGIYEFSWDDELHVAKLISLRENKWVKYKWIDDEPYHFEMEIVQDELTNDVALAITDFAREETLDDRKLIWDNQIAYLQSVIGA